MFRRSYNRALLRIKITTAAPLLIRAGETGLSPTAVDLSCVRTNHGVYGRTVYVPGSSLKGVMRQAAEAAVRDKKYQNNAVKGSCDPLDHEASCWGSIKNRRREMSTAQIYASLCLACRTFGSLALKGRASVRDLFPWDDSSPRDLTATEENRLRANRVEVRHGVAINRVTGSVEHGPFDQEIVPAGISFWGEIALENYQMWQLGFVVQAVDELNMGFARLGSSTTRGMGEVRAAVETIVHEQANGHISRPAGVGDLAEKREVEEYKLFPESELGVNDASRERGLAKRFEISGEASVAVWSERALKALGALR